MTGDDLESRVDAVDRLLPQTQCTRCGHGGCRPYAEAIVRDGVPINRCPPGGAAGIERLATLLGRPVLALDPAHGTEAPRRVARIVADLCIGCTRCIQACPVDAIAGAPRRLHAVIAEHCTGCELCLPPCPTDCIELVEPAPALAGWDDADARRSRDRFERRNARLVAGDATLRDPVQAAKDGAGEAREAGGSVGPMDAAVRRKRAMIEAAIKRARTRAGAVR
jgi:Na+-translocating ferredoxin:NAD+ oxidoreductase subunit B